MLIGFVGHFAFASFEHDRHDLIFEIAGLCGPLCAVVAFNRQFVLVFTRNAPLGCNVLSSDAHVNGVEGVVQCTQQHVNHFGVAHACAKTVAQAGVGRTAHVFCTSANSNVCVAQQDGLAG